MKKIIIIVALLVVVAGGGAGAMYFLGMPPFKKAAKKPGKSTHGTAATQQKPAQTVADGGASGHATPTPSNAILPVRPAAKPGQPAQTTNLDEGEREEGRITRLSSVYETMPAEEAGRIFAKLPDSLVEKLLRKMDERQVGKVLLALDVDRAARLTQALASN